MAIYSNACKVIANRIVINVAKHWPLPTIQKWKCIRKSETICTGMAMPIGIKNKAKDIFCLPALTSIIITHQKHIDASFIIVWATTYSILSMITIKLYFDTYAFDADDWNNEIIISHLKKESEGWAIINNGRPSLISLSSSSSSAQKALINVDHSPIKSLLLSGLFVLVLRNIAMSSLSCINWHGCHD